MNSTPPPNDPSPLQNIFSWLKNTPERAIDEAFEAAVSIKRIEEENFKGNKIANDGSFGSNVFSVFEIQLQKYLRTINLKLNFYKVSASLPYLQAQSSTNQANTAISKYAPNTQELDPVSNGQLSANQLGGNSRKFSIYQKLAFIDYTIEKYNNASDRIIDVDFKPSVTKVSNRGKNGEKDLETEEDDKFQLFRSDKPNKYQRSPKQVIAVEQSILPGSIFKAFDRVKRNLSGSYSDYEKDIVDELRQSRQRISQALRYIVLLVISVIVVQFLSKTLIFSPMINSFSDSNDIVVKFSPAIEEKAFESLRLAKERIEFDFVIRSIAFEQSLAKQEISKSESATIDKVLKTEEKANAKPEKPSPEEVETLIQQESIKILKKYNDASLDGIKNILADLTATFVFYLFLLSGRKEIKTIKEFLDEFLYSLNDNAKAFLIIISTDTFVGFHSSEGWDALLASLFGHFGIPENKMLAQLFIATVPVFLDGLFKFWIFQYLTQASPATATIYREMNE
jgi:hypothetical protein